MLSQSVRGTFTGDIDSAEMLHDVMKYIPYNRRTLTSMRCVSKPFRSAVQSPSSPWTGNSEIMLSRYGQCVIFNAQETDEGGSHFQLYSISPIGRKFRNNSARLLGRYHTLVANGLTKLVLHHSQVDNAFFEALGVLSQLRELELVSCRSLTAVGDVSRLSLLERLEVAFCPLEPDGVKGMDLPHLQQLTLRSCHKLHRLNGISKATACSLQALHVENCNVDDESCQTLCASFSENLRFLTLSNTHVSMALTVIPEPVLSELRYLHLSDTPLQLETLEWLAPRMLHLEFLSLERCNELESFRPVFEIKSLQLLDVSFTEGGEDMEPSQVSLMTNLDVFRMANSLIEEDDLQILQLMCNIRVLDAATSKLTDAVLSLVQDYQNLDTVELSNCKHISDVNVLSTCPNVRQIFCGKTSVTNEGIAELYHCNKLEILDLMMTAVTDVNFLSQCRALKLVNVCCAVSSTEGVQMLLALRSRGLQVLCDSFEGNESIEGLLE